MDPRNEPDADRIDGMTFFLRGKRYIGSKEGMVHKLENSGVGCYRDEERQPISLYNAVCPPAVCASIVLPIKE